jgi:hypothetical protein
MLHTEQDEVVMKTTNWLPSLMVCCTLACLSTRATNLYVWQDSPSPSPPYTDWFNAATNIQDAVDAAQAGDTVLVAGGVYNTGGRAVYGTMTNRVAIDKAIRVESLMGPEVTVIQGYQVPGTNNGDGAIRCVYLTNRAVLSGFTLTNGATRSAGDAYLEQSGGGLWCETNAAAPNCVLTGNAAYNLGGGAYGGTLYNCTLTNNFAGHGGGASDATLNNCTLAGNGAHDEYFGGGGAYFSTLNNCIVYFNYVNWNYSACILNFCCTTPDAGGVGNITNAPLFVDTNGWANLRLQSNSPCINAGDNSYVTNATDLDGNPRIAGGTVDIGAHEFQAPASMISYAWLQKYGLPINSSTDTADPDGDGVDNYREWLAGTDPTNPFSFPPLLTLIPYGANVILTWPTNAVGFTLQSTTNPSSPSVWVANSPAPVVISGQNTVTNPISGAQQFYRLSQ